MKFSEIDRYFSIRGTTGRKEFWAITAVVFVLMLAIWVLAIETNPLSLIEDDHDMFVGIIAIISGFVAWWVQMATAARRCRDIGITPWIALFINIPYIGILVWFILGIMSSKDSEYA